MIQSWVKSFLNKSIDSINFDSELLKPNESLDFNEQLILDQTPGGWSIDRRVSEFLIKVLNSGHYTKIIEFGAGYSTLVIKHALLKGGRQFELISIEQNADWFQIPNLLKQVFNDQEIQFQLAPVKFHFGFFGIYTRYEIGNGIEIPFDLDLQLVDGPQYYFGREGCLDFTYNKLKVGSLIILDDAERYTEKCVLYKWLKVFEGLELIYLNDKFGEKGLAILRVKSPLVRRFSISAFLLGFYQGTKRMINLNFRYKKIEAPKNIKEL